MKWKDETGKKEIEKDLAQIKKYCEVNVFRILSQSSFCDERQFPVLLLNDCADTNLPILINSRQFYNCWFVLSAFNQVMFFVGREADCPHPAEALAQEAKESPHHGDPVERWVRRRQGRLRLRNVREDHPHHGRLRQERDDRLGRRHQGKRL